MKPPRGYPRYPKSVQDSDDEVISAPKKRRSAVVPVSKLEKEEVSAPRDLQLVAELGPTGLPLLVDTNFEVETCGSLTASEMREVDEVMRNEPSLKSFWARSGSGRKKNPPFDAVRRLLLVDVWMPKGMEAPGRASQQPFHCFTNTSSCKRLGGCPWCRTCMKHFPCSHTVEERCLGRYWAGDSTLVPLCPPNAVIRKKGTQHATLPMGLQKNARKVLYAFFGRYWTALRARRLQQRFQDRQIRSEQGEALYRETVKRLAVPIHHPPTARERWFAKEAARVERERSPSSSAEDDNKEASEDNGGEEEDQSGSEDEDDSSAEDEGEDDVEEVASGKVSASSEGEAEFEAGEAAEDQAKTSGDQVESKTAAHAEQSAKDAAGAIGVQEPAAAPELEVKVVVEAPAPPRPARVAGQGTTLDDIFALMVGLNQRVGGIEADLAAVKAKRVSEAKEPALDSTPEKSAGPKGAAEDPGGAPGERGDSRESCRHEKSRGG